MANPAITPYTSSHPPLAETIIERQRGLASLQLNVLWEYRELLYFLIWKDVKIRYKQTALGVLWIVLQPLISIAIFTVIFGDMLNVPSNNLPYPIFAYAALLPWNYFTGALNRASNILVTSANLITKIYFPRLVLPLSGVLAGLVDFVIAFAIYLVMMAIYRTPLTPAFFALPLFLLLGIITALGFSLWFSALNVRYRDIIYLMPFLLQAWMYITPVIYGSTLIPERFRFLLLLNPMTGVVNGFRWSLLNIAEISPMTVPYEYLASFVVATVVFISGLIFFRNTERTFADIV